MELWGRRRDAADSESGWSDARPADVPAPGRVPAEEWLRRRRIRLRLTVILFALVFLAGSAAALFAQGGYLDRLAVERELEQAHREFFDRAARVRETRRRMEELKVGGPALERLAREELNLVREGEVTFLLVEEEPALGERRPDAPDEP